MAERGADTPRLDAELLLANALNLQRIGLFLDPDRPLNVEELGAYKSRLKRRAAREPVAYIIGQKDFWKNTFAVDRRVLIPRPETETLLEIVLKHYAERSGNWHFLDIGCGSGALVISLLLEFPNATGVGLDVSDEALMVSSLNGQRLQVDERVRWLSSDLMGVLDGAERFDVIVTNPPYVPHAEILGLQPEIFRYEPHVALDGGVDGLSVIRRLIPKAVGFLHPGGLLALEIDSRQKDAVVGLLQGCGLHRVGSLEDGHHVPRVVYGFAA
ncbi:MAG: peptide chain release factor N(5)-glutamine methyltransferase [Magnetococcales bacterium]|nr:peptide chain release factor N(5)-glutamine methyltransferase [Magnetococcales bacterium]MBF0419395.1 peptide chain release factor N(5)-glutamine methyltransferase [Magnetococcales bacterium]